MKHTLYVAENSVKLITNFKRKNESNYLRHKSVFLDGAREVESKTTMKCTCAIEN